MELRQHTGARWRRVADSTYTRRVMTQLALSLRVVSYEIASARKFAKQLRGLSTRRVVEG